MTKKVATCGNVPCKKPAEVKIYQEDSGTTFCLCSLCYDAFAWGNQSPSPHVTWMSGKKPDCVALRIQELFPEVEND